MKDVYFREVKQPALRAWQQLKVMIEFKTVNNFEGYKEYASHLSAPELDNVKILALRIEAKGMAFVEQEVLKLTEGAYV